MNYGELKSHFEGLLKRRDLTATQRDLWINAAIDRSEELLRVPPMEHSVTIPVLEAYNGELPIPSDYLQLIALSYGDEDVVPRDLPYVLKQRRNGVGVPRCFARRGSYWVLGPIPSTGSEVRLDYYQEIPALAADSDTNWLSTSKPYAILYGACSFAARHFLDRRADGFEADFLRAIGELQDRADNDMLVDAVVSPGLEYPED